MVFTEDRNIPSQIERVAVAGLRFDILFASLESRNNVDTYIRLFSKGRHGSDNIGLVQIDLYDKGDTWEIRHHPDDHTLEIVKRAYNDRVIDINEKVGVLVTVHGLNSRAEWNQEILPVASSQGWIVAPYYYDRSSPDLLFDPKKRQEIVDGFRAWVYELQGRFNLNISVIAHSFGTFIVGRYISGFDEKEHPPVCFNSIVLTGSILSTTFDWDRYRGRCVGSVYNMIAPNDEYIKFMPESSLKKLVGMSDLFGRSGAEGFQSNSDIVTESTNSIFSHTNTIRRDIVETKWMPFLNAMTNSLHEEMLKYVIKKYGRKN